MGNHPGLREEFSIPEIDPWKESMTEKDNKIDATQ